MVEFTGQVFDVLRSGATETTDLGDTVSLTVAVCTRDRPMQLDQCLEAVARLVYPRFEVLVVDNAPSNAQTREVAAGGCERALAEFAVNDAQVRWRVEEDALVAIRPLEKALALETLFFGDEVRSAEEFAVRPADVAVSDREVKMARQLIDAMATAWSPTTHADAYREELLTLLRSKSPAAAAPVNVSSAVSDISDLMEALRGSVEAAKQRQSAKRSSKRAG